MSVFFDTVAAWSPTVWAVLVGLSCAIFTIGFLLGVRDGRERRDFAWGSWLQKIQRLRAPPPRQPGASSPYRVGKTVVYVPDYPWCCFPPRCHKCKRTLDDIKPCLRRCSDCIVDAVEDEGPMERDCD